MSWQLLDGWDLHLATGSNALEPWPAIGIVVEPLHEVWCRPASDNPWAFELLLNDSHGEDWLFRRDHRVRLPLSRLGATGAEGIPFLVPEVVLLYKATYLNDVDALDFERVVATLDQRQKKWLIDAIRLVYPSHPWCERLS